MNSNRWKVALCGALVVVGGLGVVGAIEVLSDDTVTFAVSDGVCRNPWYTDDGIVWGTNDVFPADWQSGREVEGNVETVSAENLRFTSLDGTVTFDFHVAGEEGGFLPMDCLVA